MIEEQQHVDAVMAAYEQGWVAGLIVGLGVGGLCILILLAAITWG